MGSKRAKSTRASKKPGRKPAKRAGKPTERIKHVDVEDELTVITSAANTCTDAAREDCEDIATTLLHSVVLPLEALIARLATSRGYTRGRA